MGSLKAIYADPPLSQVSPSLKDGRQWKPYKKERGSDSDRDNGAKLGRQDGLIADSSCQYFHETSACFSSPDPASTD